MSAHPLRCSEHISQRAWQSESIVRSPVTGIIYAVADSYNFLCSPSSEWSYAAGRVARALDLRTGRPKSDPCWLSQNEFTRALEFQNTVYGTEFDMKVCEERDVLNTALRYPETVPAWSAPLYNHKVSDPRLQGLSSPVSDRVHLAQCPRSHPGRL